MIYKHRFLSSNILRVESTKEGRFGVPFLNWRISPLASRKHGFQPEVFQGCGLYGICFRSRLIYIGSYCGKRPNGIKVGAYFTGNVVASRWKQHFGSLTARSHNLHVSRRVLAQLKSELGNHPIISELEAASPSIYKDAGCLGPENRLRFAINNWDRFSNLSSAELLRNFTFIYARDDGRSLIHSPLTVESAILNAESEAISYLQPDTNTANRIRGSLTKNLSSRVALDMIAEILDRHLTPLRHESEL